MELVNSLNVYLERIAPFPSVILFSVGSANNIEQQYPEYLDDIISRGKQVLVIVFDPDIEDEPLFASKRPFVVHKTQSYTQYLTEGLCFLVFKEYFNVTQYSMNTEHLEILYKYIERCMDERSIFLYTEYSGIDNYVLQEYLHQKYGDDPRFCTYVDCGTVSGSGSDGRATSSCVLKSNPIFVDDYSSVIPVDTAEIDTLIPYSGHPRINTRIMLSILKMIDGDCVALRQYVGGDEIASWIKLHVCTADMFSGERTYEPFNKVRDELLTLLPLFPDETQRITFEFMVRDIVNMSKENRYDWINMIMQFVRCFSSSY